MLMLQETQFFKVAEIKVVHSQNASKDSYAFTISVVSHLYTVCDPLDDDPDVGSILKHLLVKPMNSDPQLWTDASARNAWLQAVDKVLLSEHWNYVILWMVSKGGAFLQLLHHCLA